jgi:tyrosyl-tRNA synthetase
MNIIDELKWRGLVHQSTDEAALRLHLQTPRVLYVGFDPTGPSLHVGSLLPLMLLRRFQKFGHKALALVGGATGMVGDPSGKSEERNLLSKEQLAANVAGLKAQMSQFLDFAGDNPAEIVNNYDWMAGVSYLEFLRDVGKHITVNNMMAKDSVKSRIERPDAGISYTEFSYMLLQAYDFAHLAHAKQCTLQLGGSDQWGNITAGTELGRKMHGVALYGMTCPLLLTSDGRKMGKTEKGALWLDAERTTPYAFYQYWINIADADVIMCLKFLTELPQDEINALAQSLQDAPGERRAQKALAAWLTRFIHGDAGLAKAMKASSMFFGAEIDALKDAELNEIFADVPSAAIASTELVAGYPLVDALVKTGLCSSKSEARRALQGGGISVNNRRADADRPLLPSDLASETAMVLRNGKKRYAVLRVVELTVEPSGGVAVA